MNAVGTGTHTLPHECASVESHERYKSVENHELLVDVSATVFIPDWLIQVPTLYM